MDINQINDILKQQGDRAVYVNCTFTITNPIHVVPVPHQPPPPMGPEIEEEFQRDLIKYIQEKISLRLPIETIEEILKAETDFLNDD